MHANSLAQYLDTDWAFNTCFLLSPIYKLYLPSAYLKSDSEDKEGKFQEKRVALIF